MNRQQKPIELSLEHEVRLTPQSNTAHRKLLDVLLESEGEAAAERLLPRSKFGSLIVRRYIRNSGPQSTDRYYDVAERERVSLISKMISVRERLRGSNFMTWNADPSDG